MTSNFELDHALEYAEAIELMTWQGAIMYKENEQIEDHEVLNQIAETQIQMMNGTENYLRGAGHGFTAQNIRFLKVNRELAHMILVDESFRDYMTGRIARFSQCD